MIGSVAMPIAFERGVRGRVWIELNAWDISEPSAMLGVAIET